MDMQALVDGMSAQWQRERAETQMTLGGMIETLEALPGELEIEGLGGLDSYRGYYSDLAFEPGGEKRTAVEILEVCRAAMGKTFTGYKGGDFVMGELTPMWLAHYGSCGDKIMAILGDGTVETSKDDEA